MRAHGPDGRVWEVSRRPQVRHPLAGVLPGTAWLVEASTEGETRTWRAKSRGDATRLVSSVAMALRTGGPSPAGEVDAGTGSHADTTSDADDSTDDGDR